MDWTDMKYLISVYVRLLDESKTNNDHHGAAVCVIIEYSPSDIDNLAFV